MNFFKKIPHVLISSALLTIPFYAFSAEVVKAERLFPQPENPLTSQATAENGKQKLSEWPQYSSTKGERAYSIRIRSHHDALYGFSQTRSGSPTNIVIGDTGSEIVIPYPFPIEKALRAPECGELRIAFDLQPIYGITEEESKTIAKTPFRGYTIKKSAGDAFGIARIPTDFTNYWGFKTRSAFDETIARNPELASTLNWSPDGKFLIFDATKATTPTK